MRYLEYDLTRFSTVREKNDGRSIATNAKFLRRKEQKNLCMRLRQENIKREFDPGSGRTLAACLTHASRTKHIASPSVERINPSAFTLGNEKMFWQVSGEEKGSKYEVRMRFTLFSKYQHFTKNMDSMFGEVICLVADGWVTREQSALYKGIASGNWD